MAKPIFNGMFKWCTPFVTCFLELKQKPLQTRKDTKKKKKIQQFVLK